MVEIFYKEYSNLKLKYEDINLTATQDRSVTKVIDTHGGYSIPVLINPSSNNWDISIGFQIATGTLILSGDGVSASHNYTVRLYYI